jgi:membrane associated rhomboid family serine protease
MMGFNLTPMVKNLLILNIGVFLVANVIGFQEVTNFLALRYFTASDFGIHQIITHMFMHGDFMHLLFNMFGLFMFGSALESVWGPKRFLVFYLVCGVGAALFYTGVNAFEFYQLRDAIETYRANPDPNSYEVLIYKHFKDLAGHSQTTYYFNELPRLFAKDPNNLSIVKETLKVLDMFYEYEINRPMVGASGAIFGILLGFGMLFPNTPIMLLFFPVPIKAKYFVLIYGGLELYSGIQANPGDNIAHFAHLGGMLFGFILIKYWQKQRNSFY